jgi:hypothetical protein
MKHAQKILVEENRIWVPRLGYLEVNGRITQLLPSEYAHCVLQDIRVKYTNCEQIANKIK